MDCDFLMSHVHDEQCIGKRSHVLDTTKAALKLFHFAPQLRRLFFAPFLQGAARGQLRDLRQTLDRLANRLEIGEHAA